VATAHEDLAYSSYVHLYSSGKFDNALWVINQGYLAYPQGVFEDSWDYSFTGKMDMRGYF
jgi:hypothetical protein